MEKLKNFLETCSSPYHFCEYAKKELLDAGFVEIDENKVFPESISKGFIIRRGRSLIAFDSRGKDKAIIATATDDFPCFKIVPRYQQIQKYGHNMIHLQFNGSTIWHEFTDRGLRIAGQVSVMKNGKIEHHLYDSEKPIAVIPGIAIHLDYQNSSKPTFSSIKNVNATIGSLDLNTILSEKIGCKDSEISSHNLYVSDAQKPSVMGGQILSGSHISEYISCFAALEGLINASKNDSPSSDTRICAIFDQGENGSNSIAGSDSTLLEDVLNYIFGNDVDEVRAKSLHVCCLSADANNPLYQNVYNEDLPIYPSKGVVIKRSMRADIATDNVSQFVIQSCADKLQIPTQIYQCRNMFTNSASFGTNVTTNQGIRTVDIGIPVLSLHNIRESASVSDIEMYIKLICEVLTNYSSYYVDF